MDSIGLEGLNAQFAPYYGFAPAKGRWILVDENGTPLQDSTVARLETSPVSGHTKLIAGKTAGTVYLKYRINEDCYATAEQPAVYAKNKNLDSTAVIEVHISEEPFEQGSIRVSGTLNGIAADPAKDIEGADGLTAEIEDATGKEVSRPIVWEAKELPAKGILVEDNKISFTKAGTFHVRAQTGKVHSDWYAVTALPARALAAIRIPETAALDYKNDQTLDLSALQVSGKDQYGDDWTALPALTWTCKDEGAAINGTVLSIPSAGVYTVTASAGEITSNPLTITVTDSSIRISAVTPASSTLSASGGRVEFTIKGQNLTDGITIKADDTITAATTGTAAEQKATLTFPANTDTENDKTYTVTNSLNPAVTASVTVSKRSSGGSSGGGGGGGGGGGAVSTPRYEITVDPAEHGSVTVSPKSASKGDTVTITVKPDKGYTLETLTVLDKDGKALRLTDKGSGTHTFSMPAGKAAVKATFMDDNTMLSFFVDVHTADYCYDAVLWAAQKGITSGTDAVHFSPNAPCTRAQIVTFLWRAAGSPEPKTESSFTDVSTDSYYAKAVAWAVENGITSGIGDGQFRPEDTCTRAQAVTFLARAQSGKAQEKSTFLDVPADSYYADAVAWAVQNGVTEGIGSDLFAPDKACTRA